MELKCGTPVSYELKRRTFEGIADKSKNADSLTSEYMPSYKYWIKIHYKEGHFSSRTYRTKKDALRSYEMAKIKAGRII